MTGTFTLAIDAMGGDKAPDMVVKALRIARRRHPKVGFLLVGDEQRLGPLLRRAKLTTDAFKVLHAPQAVSNEERVSHAIRHGRETSMWRALEAVKKGEAAGAVSAGNTGVLMAMAKLVLRSIPGIDRPAMATLMPTMRGESVVLDLGANAECDASNLVQFAMMGGVFARTVLGLEQPTVGILNIGSEELKGTETQRAAHGLLRDSDLPIRFHGFIEGDDIGAGTVDVVVTDGFTGNVALKTAEGTARLYSKFLKDAFRSSILAGLGYLLARGALRKVKLRTDPRRYNGAMLLGLNGVAVKSHGGTDALGFANAVSVAVDLVSHGFNDTIKQEVAKLPAPAMTPMEPDGAEIIPAAVASLG